ncbi:MAG: hypothetical protein MJD61_08820 [Proteobacteria bacterium]|nr:hypothetical protein [Pseudomonadota bacterium]
MRETGSRASRLAIQKRPSGVVILDAARAIHGPSQFVRRGLASSLVGRAAYDGRPGSHVAAFEREGRGQSGPTSSIADTELEMIGVTQAMASDRRRQRSGSIQAAGLAATLLSLAGVGCGSGAVSVCGDGVKQPDETCDPAIPAGLADSCPVACDDADPCTHDVLTGIPGQCNARCQHFRTPACDGICGDGILQPLEQCDPGRPVDAPGACPTLCEDNNACTRNDLVGSATMCSAHCEYPSIEACQAGDGCCPSGCDLTNDPDCTHLCGDGIIQPGETCDPLIPIGAGRACPLTCDDGKECTTDVLTGEAARCTAECKHDKITECVSGDGCCLPHCTFGMDSDCPNPCGDGLLQPPREKCDPGIAAGQQGACPHSCADGMACTEDVLIGSPLDCSAMCEFRAITHCTSGDGCCAPGCSVTEDSDCSKLCGDGIVQSPGESCDPAIPPGARGACPVSCDDGVACTVDKLQGMPAHCNVLCAHIHIAVCQHGDGCCPTGCRYAQDHDCDPPAGGVGLPCASAPDCSAFALECLPEAVTGWPGGLCSRDCTQPGDCPPGSVCTEYPGFAKKRCLVHCDLCERPGYGCTSPGVCAPLGGDRGGLVGDPCTLVTDCARKNQKQTVCLRPPEANFKNGYCSQICSDALDPLDCPGGSRCQSRRGSTPGLCARYCQSRSDCAPGYDCWDADRDGHKECWPGLGRIGDPCNEDGDCKSGVCLTAAGSHGVPGHPGGYCSKSCGPWSPCPPGSFCDITSDLKCYRACKKRPACATRDGYACVDLVLGGFRACYPTILEGLSP